ncbi:hypothetical protein [Rahnella sp. CJA17(1/100)]|uniref:hypothetical protein n=1 Tax=Rahnella sp. CJA17(1/100) TaxID=2508951 RepID=UPI0014300EF7|nr:hypothetical protein [Rahnella sp. CJA17(1/100)]
MKGKTLKKEIELREWQRMFNPSKTADNSSVILKKKQADSRELEEKKESLFCW